MNISLILIVISAVGLVIAFASILFVKRKKKAPKTKVEPAIAQEPKPEPKKDEGFKIARKSKGARVSRKALDSDARSAKVEQVFQRETDEMLKPDVEVEVSRQDDQELMSAIGALEKEDRKVVALGGRVQSSFESPAEMPEFEREQPKREKNAEEPNLDDFDQLGFLAKLKKEAQAESAPKEDIKDLSAMVEMDAIFNPKFKNDKK